MSESSLSSTLLFETSAAKVEKRVGTGHLSLRARGDLAPFGEAFGVALPAKIGRRITSRIAEIICLGPDEWAISAPHAQLAEIETAFAVIYDEHPHSLVNVSGREVTFQIGGSFADELLTLGLPRDLSGIPVGQGRRTVFDGVTVVLWRDDDQAFRMDVWNSFAPHVLSLLETGCRELAAEIA